MPGISCVSEKYENPERLHPGSLHILFISWYRIDSELRSPERSDPQALFLFRNMKPASPRPLVSKSMLAGSGTGSGSFKLSLPFPP